MDPRELQDEYAQLRPKTLEAVGKMLARYGEPFDRELNHLLLSTRRSLQPLPEFAVWMAEALVWGRFARRSDEFSGAAATFIDAGEPTLLDFAITYSDRFGPEKLRDALASFHRWFEELRAPLSNIAPVPVRWNALQQRSLLVARRLKDEGELRGVGLWLFPAPFKIMAVAHDEIWRDPALEAVVMPTGTQVDRALWKLHHDAVIKIDVDILGGSDGTFEDNYTNIWTLQMPQKELAIAGATSLLHINGALHGLGDRTPGSSS